MSKKRSKSNVGSAGLQRWEQAILTGQFCEEVLFTFFLFRILTNSEIKNIRLV